MPGVAAFVTVSRPSCGSLPQRYPIWKIARGSKGDRARLQRAAGVAQPAEATSSRSYPGLMTSLINVSRSSNGMNADFIALIVNQRKSSQP